MVDSPRFAYVQPRLQARFALRPSGAEWRLMEASADVDHYLQAARQTSMRPWVAMCRARITITLESTGL